MADVDCGILLPWIRLRFESSLRVRTSYDPEMAQTLVLMSSARLVGNIQPLKLVNG